MTNLQIAFQSHLENIRHNKAVEGETYRHNTVTEQQGWVTIAETSRHNKQQEGIGWSNAAAAHRQAAVQERYVTIAETKAPYETQLMSTQAAATSRSSQAQATQAEAAKQNAVTNRAEYLAHLRQLDINQMDAETRRLAQQVEQAYKEHRITHEQMQFYWDVIDDTYDNTVDLINALIKLPQAFWDLIDF